MFPSQYMLVDNFSVLLKKQETLIRNYILTIETAHSNHRIKSKKPEKMRP